MSDAAAADMPDITRRGLMLVLSSPSGAGKTTISRALLDDDANLTLSVSVTTRPKRPGEVDGRDYYFITPAEFDDLVGQGELLEYAKVFDHYYGTPRAQVEDMLTRGMDVLFDIDWQGTQQLAQKARDDLVSVFILPPSMEALYDRLRRRAQDPEHVIEGRMAKAPEEISHWAEYDYIVVNRDIPTSVDSARAILRAERHRRERQTGLTDFVKRLREGR